MPPKRILVVEDEILIAEDLRFTLQRMGHHVIGIASSGVDAVQKASELHPDLVLMDVRLQGAMDGIEAARIIRSKADIPVIYVTAHASALASLQQDWCSACLAKPFSPMQLEAAINSVLGNAPQSS
jgi:CheY-like chemotaxis protein